MSCITQIITSNFTHLAFKLEKGNDVVFYENGRYKKLTLNEYEEYKKNMPLKGEM